jgi:hypothetical protein
MSFKPILKKMQNTLLKRNVLSERALSLGLHSDPDPGMNYLSVDVECAATSTKHDARTPVSVALVDSRERILFQSFVRPEVPVLNYLTPLTGVSARDIEGADPLPAVLAKLRPILRGFSPLPILVGSGVHKMWNGCSWKEISITLT